MGPDDVERVAEILIGRGIDMDPRRLLLAGIDARLAGRIPIHKSPIDQYREDLVTLATFVANDERPPLAIYLENAARLIEPQPEAQLVRALAAKVRQGQTTVVLMNPREETHWERRHRGARSVVVGGPKGLWQKTALPGCASWNDAFEGIDAAIEKIGSGRGEIAVYASTPYAIGAHLGNRILNHPARSVRFFQVVGPRGSGRWHDFGPTDSRQPAGDAVLRTSVDLSQCNGPAIALVCQITWDADLDEVRHGLRLAGAADAPMAHLRPRQPGHDALPDRAAVDQAAHDLDSAIEAARRNSRIDSVHLFFIGPVALLMRAAQRFHQPRCRLVIHERGPDDLYRPALSLGDGGTKLVGPEV